MIMRKFVYSILVAAIFILKSFDACAGEPVIVFAAASLTDALKEIAGEFKKEYQQDVDFNFGGSTALRVQIENGAPCDIFLAADKVSSEKLSAKKIIEPNVAVSLLRNQLVVVGLLGIKQKFNSLYDISLGFSEYLAIADPKTAPAGVYAMEALKKAGLEQKLKDFIVPALDVRGALALVISGNAKYAIVYSSDVYTAKNIKILYRIPVQLYQPIVYTAMMIKSSANRSAVENFLFFLQRQKCKVIFQKYGFQSF